MLMKKELRESEDLISEWIRGETEYQFIKNATTLQADPVRSIRHIIDTELASKWFRFQLFRDRIQSTEDKLPLYLRAGQQILKACSASRGAFVWSMVLNGTEIEQAKEVSLVSLEEYFSLINNGTHSVPDSVALNMPFEDIFDISGIEVSDTEGFLNIYTGLGSLALTYLIENKRLYNFLQLPRPGLSSGFIEI